MHFKFQSLFKYCFFVWSSAVACDLFYFVCNSTAFIRLYRASKFAAILAVSAEALRVKENAEKEQRIRELSIRRESFIRNGELDEPVDTKDVVPITTAVAASVAKSEDGNGDYPIRFAVRPGSVTPGKDAQQNIPESLELKMLKAHHGIDVKAMNDGDKVKLLNGVMDSMSPAYKRMRYDDIMKDENSPCFLMRLMLEALIEENINDAAKERVITHVMENMSFAEKVERYDGIMEAIRENIIEGKYRNTDFGISLKDLDDVVYLYYRE